VLPYWKYAPRANNNSIFQNEPDNRLSPSGYAKPLAALPDVRQDNPLRHPHRSVTEIHLPLVISASRVAGIHLAFAPARIGGRYPSPFRHTCVPVAGIHPKSTQEGFPIKNVGNDADGIDSRQNHAEMTEQIPYNTGWK